MTDRQDPEGVDEQRVRDLLKVLEEERSAGRSGSAAAAEISPDVPEVDLRTLLGEMTALKAAVRAEASASREVRDKLSGAFEILEEELERARAREGRLAADLEARLEVVGRRAVLDLIDLVDRLEPAVERARELARPRWRWLPPSRRERAAAALAEGLELTVQRISRQLEERGVRRVLTMGERFDPETMEAVARAERFDLDEGVVVREVAAGYITDGWLRGQGAVVRTARVVVSRSSTGGDGS